VKLKGWDKSSFMNNGSTVKSSLYYKKVMAQALRDDRPLSDHSGQKIMNN
jgi:hypothetical protein